MENDKHLFLKRIFRNIALLAILITILISLSNTVKATLVKTDSASSNYNVAGHMPANGQRTNRYVSPKL